MVLPFAMQQKGQSLRAAVRDYHERAEGRAHVDHAFHLIVSDPTEEVLKNELPQLIAEGYTSFKIYMTYDDLKLNDGQIRGWIILLITPDQVKNGTLTALLAAYFARRVARSASLAPATPATPATQGAEP